MFQVVLNFLSGILSHPLENSHARIANLSISAPGWLWLSCILLTITTSIVLVSYRLRVRKLHKLFSGLRGNIESISQKYSSDGRHVNREGFAELEELMKQATQLKDAWWEFNETILKKEGQVYNTRQA